MQRVYAAKIVEKDASSCFRRCGRPVEMDFLVDAIIRAQPDDVTFVRHGVNEFVLAEKSA